MANTKITPVRYLDRIDESAIYLEIGGVNFAEDSSRRKLAKKYSCSYRDITIAVYREYARASGYDIESDECVRFLLNSNVGEQYVAYTTKKSLAEIKAINKNKGTESDETNIGEQDRPTKVVSAKTTVEKFSDSIDNKLFQIPNSSHIRKVGLCSDRHDMPVCDYIFKAPVSKTLMFDYEEQERIFIKWLDDNIATIEGRYVQGIMCYLSGLNCLNATVAKVCMERKIGLIFMNYDRVSNTYVKQEMIPVKRNAAIDAVLKVYAMLGRYISLNVSKTLWDRVLTSESDMKAVYCIEVCHKSNNGNAGFKITDSYMYQNMSDIYKDIYMMCDRYKPSERSSNKLFIVKYSKTDGGTYNKEVISMFGCPPVVFI